ncbi:hypothetical protein CCAX7_000230 [Capsulimonas corticalis]|uniref:Uncharacterized protein n=1 Tax=Capsulimonas corticalis TaxID=2219043 RepID=A0A402CR92_9BACT|nr:hypothetical protein [Capsulimonas corticalis]BDI27972.1 hypothetical protein CCAX7_000230 [Capsulimonas corticalis]
MNALKSFLLLTVAAAGLILTTRIGNQIMANQTDLQNKIAELEAVSNKNNADVKAAFQALETKIANAGGAGPDLQPEIDRLSAILGIENDTNAAAQNVIAQG